MFGAEEKIRFLAFSIRSSRIWLAFFHLFLPFFHVYLLPYYQVPIGYKIYLAAENHLTVWCGFIWAYRWRRFKDLNIWARPLYYSASIIAAFLVADWVSSNLFWNFYQTEVFNPFVIMVFFCVVCQTHLARNIRTAQEEIRKLKVWQSGSSGERSGT